MNHTIRALSSLGAAPLALAALSLAPAAPAAEPIRIAVIAEAQSVAGSSLPPAAQLAAEEINAQGGVDGRMIEIVTYDDHSSAAEAVRAFQRAVSEDKVTAVIASYTSEVVLALEPWAARLKTVMITPGAASDVITENIAKDYEQNKYTFHGYLTSSSLASLVCDAAKDLLVDAHKMKSAVIVSEDAAWTKPLDAGYASCLPKIGIQVLDHIRFSPDTTDFTPIFNKVEGLKPDVMITGISHVGTQPTVQWKSQQVPIPMFGLSSQASNSTFWQDTNGATEGVVFNAVSGPGVAVSPKTLPFVAAYQKKNGNEPSYAGYTTYDDVYMIADAIHRAGSTDSDRLVAALEATDYVGTIGRVRFLPKGDPHVHGLTIGPGYITGLMLQWQSGKQVNLWPKELANAALKFPDFIKLAN
ncbi:MAG: branched-chain amino acid transport system substrate-binding protein [Aliidongia sp.]|nr:branched-chain amino acid transport system substrate-binding protein [Aliidongia sp.]